MIAVLSWSSASDCIVVLLFLLLVQLLLVGGVAHAVLLYLVSDSVSRLFVGIVTPVTAGVQAVCSVGALVVTPQPGVVGKPK